MMKNLLSYFGWFKWLPRMVALMSGSLSVVREMFFLYKGTAHQTSVLWVFMWIAFLISSAVTWGQEHARVLTLERQIEYINGQEKVRAEWLALQKRFGAGFQPMIYAGWDRRHGQKELKWSFAGGWDAAETRMFAA